MEEDFDILCYTKSNSLFYEYLSKFPKLLKIRDSWISENKIVDPESEMNKDRFRIEFQNSLNSKLLWKKQFKFKRLRNMVLSGEVPKENLIFLHPEHYSNRIIEILDEDEIVNDDKFQERIDYILSKILDEFTEYHDYEEAFNSIMSRLENLKKGD